MNNRISDILGDVNVKGCSSKLLLDFCVKSHEADPNDIHDVREIIHQFIESNAKRPDKGIYDFISETSSEEQCIRDVNLMMALIDIRIRSDEHCDYELSCINRLLSRFPELVIPHICYQGYASHMVTILSKKTTIDLEPDVNQLIELLSSINYVIINQKGKDSLFYDILLYDDRMYKNLINVLKTYEDGKDNPNVQLWLLYEIQVFLKKSIDSTTLFNKVVEDYSGELLDVCIKRGEDLSKIKSVVTCRPSGCEERCHDGEWILASVLHLLSVKYNRNRPELFTKIISIEHSKIIRDVTDLNIAIRLNKSRSKEQVIAINDYFYKHPELKDRISDRIKIENEDWMSPSKEGFVSLLAEKTGPESEKERLEYICNVFKNKSSVKEEHLSLLLSIMETSLQTKDLDQECIESSINALDLLLKHTIDVDYCSSNTTISLLAVLNIAYSLLPRESRINVDGTLIDHLNEVLGTSKDYLFTPTLKVLRILSDRGTSKLETVFAICRGARYLDVSYDQPGFETAIIRGLSDPVARLYASEFMSDFFHQSMLPDYSEKKNIIDTLMWMLCDGTKKVKDNSMDALMNILQRTSIDSGRCMKILEWMEFDTDPERNSVQCKLIFYMYKSGSIDNFAQLNDKLVKDILMQCITTKGQENSMFWATNVFCEMPLDTHSITIGVVRELLEVANNPWSEEIDDITISQIFESVYHVGKVIKKSDDLEEKRKIRILVKNLIGKEYQKTDGIFNSFGRMLSTVAEADLWRDSDNSKDDYSIMDAIKDCVNILSSEDNTAVMYWVLRCLSKLMDELENRDHRIEDDGVKVISDALFGMMSLRNKFSMIGGYNDYGVRAQISMVIKKSYTMSIKHHLFAEDDPRLIGIWDTEGDTSWEVQRNTAVDRNAYQSKYQEYNYELIPEVLCFFGNDENHKFNAGDLRYGLKFATKIFADKRFAKEPDSRKKMVQMTTDIIDLLRGQMELYRTYMSVGIRKSYVVDDLVPGYVVSLFDYGIIAEISKTLLAAALKFNSEELLNLVNDHGLIALLNRILKDIPDYGTVKHTLRVLDELAEKGIYSGSTVQIIREKLLIKGTDSEIGICKDYGVITSAIKTLAAILTNVTDEKSDTLMPLMDDTTIHIEIFKGPLTTFNEDGHIRYWILRCLMPLAKCHANLDMVKMIDILIEMTLSKNAAIRRMSSILIGYGFDTAEPQVSEQFQEMLSVKYAKTSTEDLPTILRMLNSLSTLTEYTNVNLNDRFDFTRLLNEHEGDSKRKLLEEVSRIDSSELSIRGADQTLRDITIEISRPKENGTFVPSRTDMVLFECIRIVADSKKCTKECLDDTLPILSGVMDSYLEYIADKLKEKESKILKDVVPECPGYDYYRALEVVSMAYLSCLSVGGNKPFQKRNPLMNCLRLMDELPPYNEEGSGTKQFISVRILMSKVVMQTVNLEVYSEELENKLWGQIANSVLENINFDNNICKYNSLATLYVAQAVLKRGMLYDEIMQKTVRAIDNHDLICYQDNLSISRLSSHVLRRFARNGMIDVMFFDNIRSLMENNIESSMNEAMDTIPILEVLSSTFIDIMKQYVKTENRNLIRGLNIMQYNDLKRSLIAALYILSTASYKRSSRSDEGIRHMAARISSRIRILDRFEEDQNFAIPIMRYMTDKAKNEVIEIEDNSEPLDAINQAHMIVYTFSNVISSNDQKIVSSVRILLDILNRVANRYDGLLSLVNMGRINQTNTYELADIQNKLIDTFRVNLTKQEYELLSQCIFNLSAIKIQLEPDFIDSFVLKRLKEHTIFFSTANNIFATINRWSNYNVIKPIHYAQLIELLVSSTVLSTLYQNLSQVFKNIIDYFDGCYDSTDLLSISKLIDNITPIMYLEFLPSRNYEREENNLTLVKDSLQTIEKIYNKTGIGIPSDTSLELLKEYTKIDLYTAIRIFLVTDMDFNDNKKLVAEFNSILCGYSANDNHSKETTESILLLIFKVCQLDIVDANAICIIESGIQNDDIDTHIRLTALDSLLLYVRHGHKPNNISKLEEFLSTSNLKEDSDIKQAFRTKIALILNSCLSEKERIKVLDRETMANIDLYVKDDYNQKPSFTRWFKKFKKDDGPNN